MELRSPSSEQVNRSADRIAGAAGWRWALIGSVILLLVWVMTGPILQFSDELQLFVNTATTVVTFGAVLGIQSRRQAGGTPAAASARREDPRDRRGAD